MDSISYANSGLTHNFHETSEEGVDSTLNGSEWQKQFSHHPWCPLVQHSSHYYSPDECNAYDKCPPIGSPFVSMSPYVTCFDANHGYYSLPSMASMTSLSSVANASIPVKSGAMRAMPASRRAPTQSSARKVMAGERKADKKTFMCRICNDSDLGRIETSDEKAFRAHLDIHLGSGVPFVCRVCSKEFGFRSTLRNHLIAHMVVKTQLNGAQVSQTF